jgi:hypothetical protein
MDPITIAAIAAPVVGGLIGQEQSRGAQQQSEQILKDLYAKYANLQIPDVEKQRLMLEDYKSSGVYSPETETALGLSTHDPMQDIAIDPRLKQAQMNQLETLSKLGETGFSPVERAELNSMQRKIEADNTSRLQQILQQQDQRGVGSSEAGLAARLQASQSAANRQAQESEQIAAQAFERALQSKMGAGQLGAQMESNQFGQEAQKANATTNRELANFNNANSVQARNVASQNQGQMYNLQNDQNVMNQNTALRNQQQQYNKNLEQQKFENELTKLNGMSGSGQNLSNQYANNAAQTRQNWSNIGGGVGQGLSGVAMSKKPAATPAAGKVTAQQEPDLDAFDMGSFLKKMPARNTGTVG